MLCVGAHSDDIEIGAGATLLRLVRAHPRARFVWVVLGGTEARGAEARASAERVLTGAADTEIILGGFRDGFFPDQWAAIKTVVESLKPQAPDLVFCHYVKDLHQDHRVVSELSWNTFRDQMILEYEIPKWDGGMGAPNLYAPASEADAAAKIDILTECFSSQRDKDWFDADTFRGLMRLRGVECRAPERLAEAFYARKLLLG